MVTRNQRPAPRRPINRVAVEMNQRQLVLSLLGVISMVIAAFGVGVMVGQRLEQPQGGPLNVADSSVEGVNARGTEAVDDAVERRSGPKITFVGHEQSAAEVVTAGTPTKLDLEKTDSNAQTDAKVVDSAPKVQAKSPSPAVQKMPEKPAAIATQPPPQKVKQLPSPSANSTQPAKSERKTGKRIYTIQISAFRDMPSADKLHKQVKALGYDSYVQTAELKGKGTWYRVRVGKYNTKDAAEIVAQRLRVRDGLRGYITPAVD